MSSEERLQALINHVEAYSDFGMQCADYKAKTLMRYQAQKAENNGSDADNAVEVTKKKMKVYGEVGKNGMNYDFQHTGWSSDESEDAQVDSSRQLLEEEAKQVHTSFRHRHI